jgi:hypothetical protein
MWQLVIARSYEDLTCTQRVDVPIVVYNKGSGDFGIKLENVGRAWLIYAAWLSK